MLLSCGDALIDFVPVKSADGRDAYVPAVGGSCLNIAVAMSRLGTLTGLVGGAVPAGGEVVVSLERMNAIEDIDLDSGTVTVQAGAILQTVQEACREAGAPRSTASSAPASRWIWARAVRARSAATCRPTPAATA